MVWYIAIAILAGLLGFIIGARRSRKVKSRVLQQLNVQSLELLDTKSSLSQLKKYAAKHQRKDRLLKLTLDKLQQANRKVAVLENQSQAKDKKHYIELARSRLHAVESRDVAVKAAAIAKKATVHLKRLEAASPITQTIEAHQPKSYGNGDPVTVSVVDQARIDGTAEAVIKVSNRDSAKLSKLLSSNEATANQ